MFHLHKHQKPLKIQALASNLQAPKDGFQELGGMTPTLLHLPNSLKQEALNLHTFSQTLSNNEFPSLLPQPNNGGKKLDLDFLFLKNKN